MDTNWRCEVVSGTYVGHSTQSFTCTALGGVQGTHQIFQLHLSPQFFLLQRELALLRGLRVNNFVRFYAKGNQRNRTLSLAVAVSGT
jgi:hypothetical protein